MPRDKPTGGGNNEDWYERFKRYSLQTRRESIDDEGNATILHSGNGTSLIDVEGNSLLDFLSGQVCASTGHGHPELLSVLRKQGDTLIHTPSSITATPSIRLAERLYELLGPPFQKTVFSTSGSESNELAIRIAKKYTGNFEVGGLIRGYLGGTYMALSASGFGAHLKGGYGPTAPNTFFLPPPDFERFPFDGVSECLAYCREQVNYSTTGEVAAIVIEPVLSAGGMMVLPNEFVTGIREIADELGALLVFDEAQTAMGRTGKWFAHEHFTATPDIITTSKAIGGGLPLGATIVTDNVARRVEQRGIHHSASHMNDPLLCAYGLKNIELISDEDLISNAEQMGEYFLDLLRELEQDSNFIVSTRGKGLMLGLDVQNPRQPNNRNTSQEFVDECRRNGLHIDVAGPGGSSTVRILPPLNVTREEIDHAVEIISTSVNSISNN